MIKLSDLAGLNEVAQQSFPMLATERKGVNGLFPATQSPLLHAGKPASTAGRVQGK
ncbi:MAG: hypothetical protein GU347_01945 [Desulfurococcales archaeon]|nr:hypothetical protein [Desulfurococcales archaeon]